MSEELPVEQTEESTSVLVQDLGELLCERDSVRDLMLVVDRRGLDDITVMTSQEERDQILDELYAADLSGFESAGPREAGGIVEKYKIQTDEMEVSLSIYQDMTGNYQYITIAGPDRRPISEIKGPAGAFDFSRRGKLAAEVRTNTEDPLYSGTASVPASGYETKMNKLACGYALYFFETALREEAMEAAEKQGKRLPTADEWEDLCDLGSTWDEELRGRWFGGNHYTDHKGSIFLPARGHYDEGGAYMDRRGFYWSSSIWLVAYGSSQTDILSFDPDDSNVYHDDISARFLLRCVRDIAK